MTEQTVQAAGSPTGRHDERWVDLARDLAAEFAERAAEHDRQDRFVSDNYARMREARLFSAGIPAELGGGGASHATVCTMIRLLGRACGSTALAYSMHTHPLALNVYKYRRGQPAESLLRKLAANELVIAGSGANDWLSSNGSARRVEGGYRVDAHKRFVSGCPAAHVLVSSVHHAEGDGGPEVLHFGIPFSTEGVEIVETWEAIGMRGTGSHDVVLTDVFVPDGAIAARRPAGEWHPIWNAILPTALPLIMSAYLGIADAARSLANEQANADDPAVPGLLGEMGRAHTQAALAVDDMVRINDNHGFSPELTTVDAMLTRKAIAAEAAQTAVDKAAEALGGRAFLRRSAMERYRRDVRAAHFHPLPASRQAGFSGRVALGVEPV